MWSPVRLHLQKIAYSLVKQLPCYACLAGSKCNQWSKAISAHPTNATEHPRPLKSCGTECSAANGRSPGYGSTADCPPSRLLKAVAFIGQGLTATVAGSAVVQAPELGQPVTFPFALRIHSHRYDEDHMQVRLNSPTPAESIAKTTCLAVMPKKEVKARKFVDQSEVQDDLPEHQGRFQPRVCSQRRRW